LGHWKEPRGDNADSISFAQRLEGKQQINNKIKRSHGGRRGPINDDIHHGFHRPYWKHAHHDWRLVAAVILMFVAITIYVMSDDLAWRPRGHPQQPTSSTVAK
jgi:hypothetical protein